MASAIGNLVKSTWNTTMSASDQINADKLANRLVEFGHNSGAGRAGGVIAGLTGAGASIAATTVLFEQYNPLETMLVDLPPQYAAQTGAGHQAPEVFESALEATAESFILLGVLNFAVQSADATIDMLANTRHRALSLKDFPERPKQVDVR